MSNIITDSESQLLISCLCSITTFCPSLTVKKLLSFSFWLGFAYKGRNFGVLGAGDPQNLKCGDCNPQKAHLCVISSLLSVYTLKSVHGFGQAAFPRKKKSHKEHILPNFTTPWGRHRLFDREQIWTFGGTRGPHHLCQF